MRVAIIGSRGYPDLGQVERFVFSLAAKYPFATVVSGGAPGVDHQAEEAARNRMMHIRSYRPKKRERKYQIILVETGRFVTTVRDDEGASLSFKSYGQAAYFRDGLIVGDADEVVAFHYQNSPGTQHGIDQARALGIEPFIYHPRL